MQLNWKSAPSVRSSQDHINSAVDRHVPAKFRPDSQNVCSITLNACQRQRTTVLHAPASTTCRHFPAIHTCACIHHLQEFPSKTRVPRWCSYSSCSSRLSEGGQNWLAAITPSHRRGHATEFPIKSSFSSCSKFITWASVVGVTLCSRLNRGQHSRSAVAKPSDEHVT